MKEWQTIARLGAVQAAIGSIVVIMTSTLNRVLVVELVLPAAVPGALVALHFLVQLGLRPRFGFGSDRSVRRAPWIVGGMHKRLVRADPLAHLRIFLKNLAHLTGLTRAS